MDSSSDDQKEITAAERKKEAYRVTLIGFAANLLLTLAKFLAGIFGKSGAMIADAIHSLSDFLTDLVVIVFLRISAKPKDDSHDYGHGKFETLATVLIGTALLFVGGMIFINSIKLIAKVIQGGSIAQPQFIALVAAAVSILIKELLYQYTVTTGKKINSQAVIANAWHHRSDAFSSIGTLLGITGAIFLGERGRILDPIAAVIVSILIIKVSIELFIPALNELLEKSLPKNIEEEILQIIRSLPGIKDPHNLRTRKIGANSAIEFHIRVAPEMSVLHSHRIATELENRLKKRFGSATHIIIHIEPARE